MLLSGLIMSQHILDFLPQRRAETIARTLHLPLAYWGFLIMSLHLGLHWNGIMNTVRRCMHIQDASRNRVLLCGCWLRRLWAMAFMRLSITGFLIICFCGSILYFLPRIKQRCGL